VLPLKYQTIFRLTIYNIVLKIIYYKLKLRQVMKDIIYG